MKSYRITFLFLAAAAVGCSTGTPVSSGLAIDVAGGSNAASYSQWTSLECSAAGSASTCSEPCRQATLYVSSERCGGYSQLKTGCISGVSIGWTCFVSDSDGRYIITKDQPSSLAGLHPCSEPGRPETTGEQSPECPDGGLPF
jgi:hypothetical protein